MPARRIFHELLTSLDHGLLQDLAVPTPQPSTIQQAIPLDFGENFRSLLSPTNRLIYSPHMMEATLLQPFLAGVRQVIVVCTHSGKTFPATLQAVHSSYLIIDTQQSLFRRKRGDTVLVVFPMAPQQHYVLQTVIHRVYAFRLELTYRDPRYDIRHAIPLATPVTLQPVPTTLLTAVEQQQGHIVRQITLNPRDTQGITRSAITDLFCPPGCAEPADSHATHVSPVAGVLHDISLGGTCLTLEAAYALDALPYRLVRLTIPLPSAPQGLADWAYVSLTLQLLGVVRSISQVPSTLALHIRFLNRLFPEIDTLLWHLEGGFPDQPPLSPCIFTGDG